MCGFSGFWDPAATRSESETADIVAAMAATLAHRGPDDSGLWCDTEAGFAVGHRRLKVIDLSPNGHQPMASSSGRLVLAYNGEIYNAGHLRAQLSSSGARFRGHSDTEILLASIEEWGLRHALNRAVGMFAFALWDRQERTLTLCRDRFGEKPLYYGYGGGAFLFGSELKALRRFPGWQPEVDRNALSLFLRHTYIPEPWSIFKGIRKLPPGCLLVVDHPASERQPERYWSAADVIAKSLADPFSGSMGEAAIEVERLLRESVQGQLTSDVPVGALLSGGIDSSTVVALMTAASERRVRTFTVGFDEAAYDETDHARAVAQVLGTEHTEVYLRPSDACDVIPLLPQLYDEPFADSSQIPTFLVSRVARQHVTVALSGDGGDELFGGYGRYFLAGDVARRVGRIPAPVRGLGVGLIRAMLGLSADTRREPRLPIGRLRPKLQRVADALAADGPDQMYARLVTNFWGSRVPVLDAELAGSMLSDLVHAAPTDVPIDRMMFYDTLTYLPGDLLVKVDRAAMAVSLETRLPFLNPDLFAFAWSLPSAYKTNGSQGKLVLRSILARSLPSALVERPKMGFGVPVGEWLRSSLRDWAEDLLDESKLRQAGFFEVAPIRTCWREHLSGVTDWQWVLWSVLMFQSWLEAAPISAEAEACPVS